MPLWWMLVEHNSRRAPTLRAELEATTNVSAGRFALDADIQDGGIFEIIRKPQFSTQTACGERFISAPLTSPIFIVFNWTLSPCRP